jgi:hypothetical protein
LPGRWPKNTRLLPGHFTGCYADDSADDTPDILPDAARTLRDLRPYLQVRGWCLTKIPAFAFQKAATVSVRLNVSNACADVPIDNALNGRSETGSETERRQHPR